MLPAYGDTLYSYAYRVVTDTITGAFGRAPHSSTSTSVSAHTTSLTTDQKASLFATPTIHSSSSSSLSSSSIISAKTLINLAKALTLRVKLDRNIELSEQDARKLLADRQNHYSSDHPCAAYATDGKKRICLGYFSKEHADLAACFVRLVANLRDLTSLNDCGFRCKRSQSIQLLRSTNDLLAASWELDPLGAGITFGKVKTTEKASAIPLLAPITEENSNQIDTVIKHLGNNILNRKHEKEKREKYQAERQAERQARAAKEAKEKLALAQKTPTTPRTLSPEWLCYRIFKDKGIEFSEEEARKLLADRQDHYSADHPYAAYATDGKKRICLGYFSKEHSKHADCFVCLAANLHHLTALNDCTFHCNRSSSIQWLSSANDLLAASWERNSLCAGINFSTVTTAEKASAIPVVNQNIVDKSSHPAPTTRSKKTPIPATAELRTTVFRALDSENQTPQELGQAKQAITQLIRILFGSKKSKGDQIEALAALEELLKIFNTRWSSHQTLTESIETAIKMYTQET